MPNFNRPPPPYGSDGQNGYDPGEELWVENKSPEGKVGLLKNVMHNKTLKLIYDIIF